MLRYAVALMAPLSSVICVLTLLASLTGCQNSLSVDRLIAEAQQYRQRGETQAAIIQLKNAIQKDPESQQARVLLGQIYIDIGNPLSAEKEFRKALSLGANSSEIMPQLGESMLMLGRADQLIAELKEWQGHYDRPALMVIRANALLAIGKTDESRQLFDKILKNDPSFEPAILGLAKIAIRSNKLDLAATLIKQALEINSNNIDALRLNGDLSGLLGNSKDARVAYGKILALLPGSTQAHIDIANIDGGMGKFDDARNHISAARKIAPTSLQVLQAQALLDFREGKLKSALDLLQKIVLAAPNHMPSILLMGTVQLALGSPQQAEQYISKFIQANPNHIYANKMLASIKLRTGQPEAAIGIANSLLANNPNDMQLFAFAGEVELLAKHFEKAAEHLQMASNSAPKNPMIHTALAVSLLGMEEKEQAIVELERANSLDATNLKTAIMLVMANLRAKKFDKAMLQISSIEKQHATNPAVPNLKGAVFLAKGDMTGARISFDKALNLESGYLPALQNLARLDMAENKIDQAKKRFDVALHKDPKNADLMTELAKLAIFENKPKEAQQWLERAKQENPDVIAPALLLGYTYLQFGEKQKALQIAQNLHASNASNPEILALLAQAQNDNDQVAAALSSYNQLATLWPRSAAVQMRIGNLQLIMKNQDEALQAFKKAMDIGPDLLAPKKSAASLLTLKGNYGDATTIAKSLEKEHPDFADGYKLEGDISMRQNKPLPALKLYEQAFSKSKSNAIAINIHQALTLAKKHDEARSRISDWLRQHPSDLLTRFYLAGHYMASNQFNLAIEQLDFIVQHDSKNVIALNDLAVSYQYIKDKRALPMAERAYKLESTNPKVMDTLGWVVLENGNIERAVDLLKKSVALAPNSPEMRYHLGIALIKYGDKKGAKTQLEYLLATKPIFPSRAEVNALLAQI
jgi:cellulose synthase operon protein C